MEQASKNFLEIRPEILHWWGLSCWKKFNSVFPEFVTEPKLRNIWEFLITNEGNVPESDEEVNRQLPLFRPDFSPVEGHVKVTWLGHSTVLIQDGLTNILVDPIFAERPSPISFIGPKRYRPVPCSLTDLPAIHAVFISHDHYDHFDIDAVRWLATHRSPVFFVGLESNDLFTEIAKVVYLDWNAPVREKINDREYMVHFFPVCHWSKRAIFDTNKRLWGGFVIETPDNMRFFYSGDTGFCKVFEQVGEKYKQFDLALIPIGAYKPRPFLAPQHVNPEQAVMIHRLIHSKKSIGVHWGTFPLGKEHYLAPRKDLEIAKRFQSVPEQDFVCMQHGNFLLIPKKQQRLAPQCF